VKTYYSAQDIEELVSQGVRELIVDDDTMLTAVARERATQLGVKLVPAGQGGSAKTATPAAQAVTPLKPLGCQHGLAGKNHQSQTRVVNRRVDSNSPIVDDLIGAVKRLATRDYGGRK
jgi:hypothetical protein